MRLPQIGDAFRLDYERIVALAPTVAVVWETGTPAGVAERLEGLGIRVVSMPTRRLDDIATGLLALGELAGTRPVAEAAARDFRARIAALAGALSRTADGARLHPDRRRAALHGRRAAPHHRDPGTLRRRERVRRFGRAGAAGGPRVGPRALAGSDSLRRRRRPGPYWARFGNSTAVARGNVYRSRADLLARPSSRIAEGAADVCARLDEARGKLDAP